VAEVTDNIVEMAQQLEPEVEAEDVAELLESHEVSLTNDELLELDEQRDSCLLNKNHSLNIWLSVGC
jgi:hypothetical protein